MSFILDALRKSEIERQRQSGPGIAAFADTRADRRTPWALAAIGALLALNVAVVLYFMLRDDETAPPPASPATAQPLAPVASPPAASVAAITEYPERETPTADRAAQPPAEPEPTLVPQPPPRTASVTYGDDPAPPADALAARAAEGLPELSMDLHIFATDRAKRAVFINGRRYTEGATIAEGPIVEEITSEGAVLNYRGRRFLLPRL